MAAWTCEQISPLRIILKKNMDDSAVIGDELIEIIDLNYLRARGKYATITKTDRARIIHCARNGSDMKLISEILKINIKTCRSIAYTDREETLRRGFPRRKIQDYIVTALCNLVDDKPQYSIRKDDM